ncbi:MAG TPA: iron-containing alcohol dehydrogenase [Thermoplasmata archaeon]|nr:iron-containing alcohol dehydrogenase [Thermoplasmata archaeon]
MAWGPGAIEQLSGLGAHRALVVVDPNLARSERQRRIVEELQKTDTVVEVTSEVTVEPTLASLEPGLARARGHRPDWIVAVGGGSTIDTAKGIWIRYARPEVALDAVTPLVDLSLRTVARFVAIPTTCGSGSDATWVAHLREEDGRILDVGARELMPDWSLLDPTLTDSLPPTTVAEGGGDLLARALESIASEWTNLFSHALAVEAVGLAISSLPAAVRPPGDPEARERLHQASTLAGLASANSQLGVVHALAHAISSVVHVPYARLTSTLLPYGIEFNFPAARERYMGLGPVIGPASVQNRSALTERLRSLWGTVGLPTTLPRAGVPADLLTARRAEIVERARRSPALVSNPRLPSVDELGRLLDTAAQGGAVGF